ncbi:phage portal protein [Nocardiopsis sp. NPDC049922]|uniref:phage portal protein n=1 Tax=Nocardiopsis sp. NPDC049922 TaxID=3155157 RepID=UPI0033F00F09
MVYEFSGAPETPTDWMHYLEGKLAVQQGRNDKYQKYYDSEERVLAFAQKKFAEEFGGMFVDWRDNFCSLVVDSISERLNVRGFRMSEQPEADKDAQEIWQRNFLDADSNAAHIAALVSGRSYLAVWGDKDDNPIISPETSSEVVVQYKPGSRRELQAGLKQYRDDWGTDYCTLWTPEAVYTSTRGAGKNGWGDPKRESNPLGVVPLVALENRARLRRTIPYSEIHPVIPLQDAITKIAADAIVASEFAAYPQRVLAGIEIPVDENGNEIAPVRAAIDRMFLLEDKDARWGQFEAADLNNYVNLINMLVQHISTISRVPPHYFLINGGQAPSGESIQSAEAGLVAKARERQLHFGEAWEQAMRLAFKVKGDSRAEAWHAETIWDDPEYRSEGVRVDALVKLRQGLGVPRKQLWEDYGYTPSQIERFEQMAKDEQKAVIEEQRALAAVTGAQGGSAPAGNGTKAGDKQAPGNAGNNARKTGEVK